jgi:hypothetical protein
MVDRGDKERSYGVWTCPVDVGQLVSAEGRMWRVVSETRNGNRQDVVVEPA